MSDELTSRSSKKQRTHCAFASRERAPRERAGIVGLATVLVPACDLSAGRAKDRPSFRSPCASECPSQESRGASCCETGVYESTLFCSSGCSSSTLWSPLLPEREKTGTPRGVQISSAAPVLDFPPVDFLRGFGFASTGASMLAASTEPPHLVSTFLEDVSPTMGAAPHDGSPGAAVGVAADVSPMGAAPSWSRATSTTAFVVAEKKLEAAVAREETAAIGSLASEAAAGRGAIDCEFELLWTAV